MPADGQMLREDVADRRPARSLAAKGDDGRRRRWPRSCAALPARQVRIQPIVTDEIDLPDRRRGRAVRHRAGQRAARRRRPLRRRPRLGALQRRLPGGAAPSGSTTWTSRRGRSSRVATALIPFLEHDDANRALMGANMQRQAVPLLEPEAPIVGTGMECQAARDSGQVVVAEQDGEVVSADRPRRSSIRDDDGARACLPAAQVRALQPGHLHQPAAQRRRAASACRRATCSPTAPRPSNGELALGQNVLVRLHGLGGRQLRGRHPDQRPHGARGRVHLASTWRSTRSTRATPSSARRRSPATSRTSARRACKDLDERGIICVGAEVGPGDILVGKITPKGETELTAEERLLRAIFGEKAREVKDTSLRVPQGERGKVVEVKVFTPRERRRAAAGRQPAGARQHRAEAQDLRGRQDGRAPRQQGRDLAHRAGGGHAVPARRHAGRHHPEPAGRAQPHEHRPDPGDAPGLGGRGAGLSPWPRRSSTAPPRSRSASMLQRGRPAARTARSRSTTGAPASRSTSRSRSATSTC